MNDWHNATCIVCGHRFHSDHVVNARYCSSRCHSKVQYLKHKKHRQEAIIEGWRHFLGGD